MRPDATPVANPLAVLREEFDDWAVIFNPDTGHAVGINPVGVVIWKHLDGRHTFDALLTEIQRTFDDVPDTAREDVDAFLHQLVDVGFVSCNEPELAP
jgi:SynChlorMet cassette protein ScmD